MVVVGTWKAGGIVVSVNPMSRQRELTTILTDCDATAIVSQEDLWSIASGVLPNTNVRIAFTHLAAGVPDEARRAPVLRHGADRLRGRRGPD